MNQVTISPMLAEKIAITVIHSRKFVQRLFTRFPIRARLLVISRIKSKRGGVEKPCTIPDQTSAFLGLKPRKFRATPHSREGSDANIESLRFLRLGMQTAFPAHY